MKKIKLFFNIFLIILLLCSIIGTAFFVNLLSSWLYAYHQSVSDPDMTGTATTMINLIVSYSILSVVEFLTAICATTLLIILNPRLFRRSTYTNFQEKIAEEWEQNKEERLAAKQAKQEADKQKRIEELQSQLDELKKD